MQFVYQDGDGCIFMDTNSDEQISLSRELVGELPLYLKEGMRCARGLLRRQAARARGAHVVELVVADTEPPARAPTNPGTSRRRLINRTEG